MTPVCFVSCVSSVEIVVSAANSGSSDSMLSSPSVESLPEPNTLIEPGEFASKLRRKNCIRFAMHGHMRMRCNTLPGVLNKLANMPAEDDSDVTDGRGEMVESKSLASLAYHRGVEQGKFGILHGIHDTMHVDMRCQP